MIAIYLSYRQLRAMRNQHKQQSVSTRDAHDNDAELELLRDPESAPQEHRPTSHAPFLSGPSSVPKRNMVISIFLLFGRDHFQWLENMKCQGFFQVLSPQSRLTGTVIRLPDWTARNRGSDFLCITLTQTHFSDTFGNFHSQRRVRKFLVRIRSHPCGPVW